MVTVKFLLLSFFGIEIKHTIQSKIIPLHWLKMEKS